MKKLSIFLALALCLSLSSVTVFAADKNPDTKKQEQTKKNEKKQDAKGSVFVTKNGKKYHKDKKCSSLKNSKEIQKVSIKEAKKNKITPCKICYPNS